jgi:homocitrate synthase
MCPTCEPEQTNGHANGTNGNTNGNLEGYTGVQTRNNPRPDHVSPYKPVGDFLSNVSRFKIIGTSSTASAKRLRSWHYNEREIC